MEWEMVGHDDTNLIQSAWSRSWFHWNSSTLGFPNQDNMTVDFKCIIFSMIMWKIVNTQKLDAHENEWLGMTWWEKGHVGHQRLWSADTCRILLWAKTLSENCLKHFYLIDDSYICAFAVYINLRGEIFLMKWNELILDQLGLHISACANVASFTCSFTIESVLVAQLVERPPG